MSAYIVNITDEGIPVAVIHYTFRLLDESNPDMVERERQQMIEQLQGNLGL